MHSHDRYRTYFARYLATLTPVYVVDDAGLQPEPVVVDPLRGRLYIDLRHPLHALTDSLHGWMVDAASDPQVAASWPTGTVFFRRGADRLFRCPCCPGTFLDLPNGLAHFQDVHPELFDRVGSDHRESALTHLFHPPVRPSLSRGPLGRIVCPCCDKHYARWHSLRSHLDRKHGRQLDEFVGFARP